MRPFSSEDLSTGDMPPFWASLAHLYAFALFIPSALPTARPEFPNNSNRIAWRRSSFVYCHFLGLGVYSLLQQVHRYLLLPAFVFPMLCWPVSAPHCGHFLFSLSISPLYHIADCLATPGTASYPLPFTVALSVLSCREGDIGQSRCRLSALCTGFLHLPDLLRVWDSP